MKQLIITTLTILTTISFSFSQDYQIRQAMDLYRINKVQSGEFKMMLTEDDIKGSPYLNDEFITGTIFTKSKFQFVDVPLRYNIYNDQIEFKTPTNEIQALETPEIIETVEFGDYKMVYIPYTNSKKIKYGFFLVEEKGDVSLYSKKGMQFRKAEEPGAYKEAEPAKFIKKPDSYYIRIDSEQAKRVDNKKELLAVFPDHKDKIKAFVKKNKVKTNNPEKLKELVRYYNSIKSN